MDARQLSEYAREPTPNMASPPYPDIRKLVNIPSGSDKGRELEGARQSELNKVRVLSEEARNELQNSHLRDAKTKAIPDHDEAGQDRSQKGMAPLQAEAYKDYEDPRAPRTRWPHPRYRGLYAASRCRYHRLQEVQHQAGQAA